MSEIWRIFVEIIVTAGGTSVGVLAYIYDFMVLNNDIYAELKKDQDKDEVQQLIQVYYERLKEFSEYYYKHNLYIDSALSKKYLNVIGILHQFIKYIEELDKLGDKLDEVAGHMLTESGEAEINAKKKLFMDLNGKVAAIIKNISEEGGQYDYYTLCDEAKKYFNKLSVI